MVTLKVNKRHFIHLFAQTNQKSYLGMRYTDRNLIVESTIFYGKPEPLGISASYTEKNADQKNMNVV